MIKAACALLFFGVTFEVCAQDPPSIREILLRAKASYDLTLRLSADVEVKVDTEAKYTLPLVWMRDGNRYRLDSPGVVDAFIPAMICFFDGREFWTYSETHTRTTPIREAHVDSGPEAARVLARLWRAGFCLDGMLYGDMEDVFTILLRQINSAKITVTPETLDGRECFHIESSAPEGEYELWLDPSVAYRLRKSIVRKSGENLFCGKPIKQSSEWSSIEATVTDIDVKNVVGGTLAVSGRLLIQGRPSPLSSRFGRPEGDVYVFSRSNCRLGATLSAKDLTLKLSDDAQISRRGE